MAASVASVLSSLGILIAIVGAFFLGGIALLVGIVLIGAGVIVVEGELGAQMYPSPKEPSHPFRYACPGCGGDVYGGQTTCPVCGVALPAAVRPTL